MLASETSDGLCAGPAPVLRDYRDVPVVINSYDRVFGLERLVAWLRAAGHRRIVVLDNQSTYPPLLAYLQRVERRPGIEVVRLDGNFGHLALWTHDVLSRLGIATEYVYTDPDVVPSASCPANLVARLQQVLRDEPSIHKVGPGLRLDDLPEHYARKPQVLAWEAQFWTRPAAPGLFFAPIDTTFALYRAGSGCGLYEPSLRTGAPFLARHLGWYANSGSPSAEDSHYASTARPGISWWSTEQVSSEAGASLASQPKPPSLLVLGSRHPTPHGYRTFADHRDRNPGVADEAPADGVLIETLPRHVPWDRLASAVRPGGLLVVRCPLGELGTLLGGDARLGMRWWRRQAGFTSGWTPCRVTLIRTRPQQAILHLRRDGPDAPATGALSSQRSRLDRWAVFQAVTG